MFSKDPEKRKIQVEAALKNKKLSEKGRQTLLKMKKELEDMPLSSKKASKKKSTKTKSTKNQYGVKEGDIFCEMYGWDATKYNFYEVTEVLDKSRVKVKELNKRQGTDENTYGYNDWNVRPGTIKSDSEELIRTVKKCNAYPEGSKKNLFIKGELRTAIGIDREEAFNKDWHEEDYY